MFADVTNKQTNSATKPAMQAKILEIITNKICNEERSWAQNILRELYLNKSASLKIGKYWQKFLKILQIPKNFAK